MINRPEETLHRAVARFLSVSLPDDAWFAHVPNGGARSKAEAGILKALGVKAGVPDLLIIWRGQAHWIELKAPPKKLSSGKISQAKPAISDAQLEMVSTLNAAGCKVAFARSIEDVWKALTAMGIPMKVRAE